ncbi:uncharacterized protein VICG_00911 [Vittaforma corneae ATCC 50505]|uniref:Glutaredoxin domain-containing protein n=1 Tax=Vittaforma corneae (strain ATCC 50505) TaxID=993615 RepID=L2GP15_VITCO|nr:uncharacterized protein VICG_00911 [Vittaforma corneae ATCC 50505]ELA42062.1 hypothetical protein VICG_00911 [Vittaforma corneae ATCC 50505]
MKVSYEALAQTFMHLKWLFLVLATLIDGKVAYINNNEEAAIKRAVEKAVHNLTDEELMVRNAVKDEGYEISPWGITVIIRENCYWSKTMLKYLDDRDVKYNLIVAKDMDSMTDLLHTMRHVKRKFPAVYVDDMYVGGYEKALNDSNFNEWVNNKGIENGLEKDSVV